MFAELPQMVTDLGAAAAVLVALAAALAVCSRSRLVRWLWRALLGDPIGRWAGSIVATQVNPVREELAGLRTDLSANTVDLKDLRTELVTHMGAEESLRSADIETRDRRQDEMDAWRDEVRSDISEVKEEVRTGLGTVHRRIDTALQRLADGNPEVRP